MLVVKIEAEVEAEEVECVEGEGSVDGEHEESA